MKGALGRHLYLALEKHYLFAKELLYVSNIDCVVIGDEIYDLTGQNNDDRFNKNLIYPTT